MICYISNLHFQTEKDPDLVKFNYQRRDSYAFFHFLSNNIKAKQPVADARMIVDFDKERFSRGLNSKQHALYDL